MQQFLMPEEVAALNAIQKRLRTTRPEGRGAEAHIHDAVYDGISAVMFTGQGVMSTERTFADAGKSVRKAVMAS
jgi:hypothetical protein